MKFSKFIITAILSILSLCLYAQEVPIISYEVSDSGQVLLEVESDIDHYYILKIRHDILSEFKVVSSITMGEAETTILTEPLESYPIEYYQVLKYALATPFDTDADGVDDIMEYNYTPAQGPLNHAPPVALEDGLVSPQSLEDFRLLSLEGEDISWAPFLNGREFVKFGIENIGSDNPKVYYINSKNHPRHLFFYYAVGVDYINGDLTNGEIIYHPEEVADDGTLGVFTFAYSEGFGRDFEVIQKTNELLAANMPFLKNNLSYFVTLNGEENYLENQALFDVSRVAVLFESDVYSDIDFLPINPAEGYGRFRVMDLEETPGARDVVLYEALPNTLPRVAGIVSSFIQTPLSHVNLRAIQDNIPNAFIKDPLTNGAISALVDTYVHYEVTADAYILEAATIEEVNAWHDANRPTEIQKPPLNLSYTEILPLEKIDFKMSDGFGAKCTNIATMLAFGFPENTTPNGFGVPFYFYQEFMKHNGFFERVRAMMANTEFQTILEVREDMLKDLRKDVKKAEMPQWMLDALQEMHNSFPVNSSVRVRSSTNNEDLPGFSGAGLYDSKTQKPDEGHMSKSIKQVYASMWNFRAFEERDYYRVDHFLASMGALCHLNYKDEKANGVGVTTDPIYNSEDTFYLNTQVGEDLVTNPDALSIPEEILMNRYSTDENDFVVVRRSNQTENGALVMEEQYLNQLRDYMNVIHDEFAILYNAEGNEAFAMDIEYKVTAQDQLIIKQARPWSSFWTNLDANVSGNEDVVVYFPNPTEDEVHFICDCKVTTIRVASLSGKTILEQAADFNDLNSKISLEWLASGLYLVYGLDINGEVVFSKKIIRK
jgi:hypothetical protein